MIYNVGTELNIKNRNYKVLGYIEYTNPRDDDKNWIEYRLRGSEGEVWLSVDDCYNEYSLSWPANEVRGNIGPEWHQVDEGAQIVRSYAGNVDVDRGEMAEFVEYEDVTEDKTLSVEMWSDGTEYSKGEYIEKSDIVIMKVGSGSAEAGDASAAIKKIFGLFFVFVFAATALPTLFSNLANKKAIQNYLKNSSAMYTYETSVTGNEKQKAEVYRSTKKYTTDEIAKAIINGIEGETESVTQKNETANEEIAIVTKYEYCLIYHPEDDPNAVLIQISSRKYNYTSDNAPYKSSSSNTSWYRSHYYSSSYASDSSTYKKASSAYSMYSGETVHNIGNGYFDSYSKSVKQSSVNSRNSSSGGISSGK